MSDEKVISRRSLLMKIGILLNGAVATVIAVPIVGFLLGPILKKGSYDSWIMLGDLAQFPQGETRLADFTNPQTQPWDGATAKSACYVRRTGQDQFQVFAVNCAHLGCPVRWFPQSELFMCPCHGGVYYADGSRAAGPPPRGLFEYPYKIQNGKLMIFGGQMPTLSTTAELRKGCDGCDG
ncbi:MAG TPA: Rieske 2Fe-2S domain-containing protein [Acidobacteriaceae bacterium]|jgi:Rieske Fe-S protein|nr:Rieske 2Fe-2S domain-containing protein [Acidobacteriaceae bacterium]